MNGKKNYDTSNIRNDDPLYSVAADICALYPSIKRERDDKIGDRTNS